MTLRIDAETIIHEAIASQRPEESVKNELYKIIEKMRSVFIVAVGKAAWSMASSAAEVIGDRLIAGIVITKYGHIEGQIPKITCYEAGHPILDQNGLYATQKAIDLVSDLHEEDHVVFLLSGGASALFEKPLIAVEELNEVNRQLLASGASIQEINTIRKRLSGVKGGRFAKLCEPAKVTSIILSDVLGDRPDMIGSGPTIQDESTSDEAKKIADRLHLNLSLEARQLLECEIPKQFSNVSNIVIGSVSSLVNKAITVASNLGYEPVLLSDCFDVEAKELGRVLGCIARSNQKKSNVAFISGGETIVHLTGNGKGGRNQEVALSAAQKIAGMKNVLIFSVGSDGTDGPTDAAGGMVDGTTALMLHKKGISISDSLENNDAYHALKAVNGLIMTGPTGTNVNDLAVILMG